METIDERDASAREFMRSCFELFKVEDVIHESQQWAKAWDFAMCFADGEEYRCWRQSFGPYVSVDVARSRSYAAIVVAGLNDMTPRSARALAKHLGEAAAWATALNEVLSSVISPEFKSRVLRNMAAEMTEDAFKVWVLGKQDGEQDG